MDAATLGKAMGNSLTATRYAQLAPAFNLALTQSGCTTVARAAMFCAQVGHESAGLRYMEELASGSAYEGRRDLGNTQRGDGVRFKGRGPIQITGRHNYTALSKWAHSKGYVPTADYFVANPAKLASDQYGFIGVVWYWTTQRPMNSYADRGDILGATRAVNGGTNGYDDRRARWTRCKAIGKALLPAAAAARTLKAAVATKTVTTTAVYPTAGSIHTPYGARGPYWSYDRDKNGNGIHTGDDWHRGAGDAEAGDPIVAVTDGKVIYAGRGGGWGSYFGNHVLVTSSTKLPGESFYRTTIYAHMNTAPVVRSGQSVKAGALLGRKGKTGNVSGVHLHLEQHAGQRWGDRRLKPVYPGTTTTTTTAAPAKPKEFLDMATQQPIKHRKKTQTVAPTKNGKPKVLYLEDNSNVTWAFGAGTYWVECFIRFSGTTANGELLARPMYVDTNKKTGKQIGKPHYDYTEGKVGGDGKSFRKLAFMIKIGAPKKGNTRRNRIAVENYTGKNLTISEVITRVWKAD